jgi:hypothetical protein
VDLEIIENSSGIVKALIVFGREEIAAILPAAAAQQQA